MAAAVKGGKNDLEIVGHFAHHGRIIGHGHHIAHKTLVALVSHDGDHTADHSLVVGDGSDVLENINFRQLFGNGIGMLGRQLGAVFPIDLVTVVFLGIVAGGDVDTGLAVVFPNGKTQLRRRAQGIKNAHADAVAHHNFGSGAGKIHAVDAAVHADGDAALFGFPRPRQR